MIDGDDDNNDDDAKVKEIEVDVRLVYLGKKETREPPFLGMFLCD
jgi:hypothetical protein